MAPAMLVVVMRQPGEEIRVESRRVAVGSVVTMCVLLLRVRVESRQQQQDRQKKGEEASPPER